MKKMLLLMISLSVMACSPSGGGGANGEPEVHWVSLEEAILAAREEVGQEMGATLTAKSTTVGRNDSPPRPYAWAQHEAWVDGGPVYTTIFLICYDDDPEGWKRN